MTGEEARQATLAAELAFGRLVSCLHNLGTELRAYSPPLPIDSAEEPPIQARRASEGNRAGAAKAASSHLPRHDHALGKRKPRARNGDQAAGWDYRRGPRMLYPRTPSIASISNHDSSAVSTTSPHLLTVVHSQ